MWGNHFQNAKSAIDFLVVLGVGRFTVFFIAVNNFDQVAKGFFLPGIHQIREEIIHNIIVDAEFSDALDHEVCGTCIAESCEGEVSRPLGLRRKFVVGAEEIVNGFDEFCPVGFTDRTQFCCEVGSFCIKYSDDAVAWESREILGGGVRQRNKNR